MPKKQTIEEARLARISQEWGGFKKLLSEMLMDKAREINDKQMNRTGDALNAMYHLGTMAGITAVHEIIDAMEEPREENSDEQEEG